MGLLRTGMKVRGRGGLAACVGPGGGMPGLQEMKDVHPEGIGDQERCDHEEDATIDRAAREMKGQEESDKEVDARWALERPLQGCKPQGRGGQIQRVEEVSLWH